MALVLDRRCGGEKRYILVSEGESLMVIPDEMRKCVVFVGYRKPSDQSVVLCGSAFWIVRPRPHFPEENIAYMITAGHIVKGITNKNISTIILRINYADGNWGYIETKASDWVFHDDPAADVAVLCLGFHTAQHDHRAWAIKWSATPETIKKHGIGPGDDLFFIGLFTKHYGTTKNIPIVRMGNIAAMPLTDNPVRTKVGPMVAYLAEARSIGGLSGSPVFIDLYGSLRRGPFQFSEQFVLLGLVHGHYDEEDLAGDELADDGLQKTNVNMGIAVVIPVERVLEVLKKFSDSEEQEARARLKKIGPTMDIVGDSEQTQTTPGPDGIDIPIPTTEQFFGDLEKASRRKE